VADCWDQIRTLLRQFRPADRHAIRWWLSEGLAFGERYSREAREAIAKHSPEAARVTERLEPLIRTESDRQSVHTMLDGMDPEHERLSELNDPR
jgi:hypothetical protein